MKRRGTFTRTFKRSGAALLLGTVLVALAGQRAVPGGVEALGIVLLTLAVPVFAVSATRHLLRGLLRRVGSRLFVSYLLVGLVPIGVFLGLGLAVSYLLAGQLAVRRVEAALLRRADTLRSGDGRPAVLAHAGDLTFFTPAERVPAGTAPTGGERLDLDGTLEAALEAETGIVVGFGIGDVKTKGPKGEKPESAGENGTLTIESDTESIRIRPRPPQRGPRPTPPAPASRPGGLLEARWIRWFGPLSRPVVSWRTGAPEADLTVALLVRTSIGEEFRALYGPTRFSARSTEGPGSLALFVLKALAVVGGVTYGFAAILASFLVARIARATRRLSRAFAELDRGNFAHRASLRGADQLSDLVASFNQMAGHLEESVAARAEREALGRELRIARDLQQRLLPPPDFDFPGVELAVDFQPAAAIGGDFYHFVAEGRSRLTVVVADVSGHGLPAGLVMASATASLSVLSRSGSDTPALLSLLDAEIRRVTDRRTFVTLGHLLFDFDAGVVRYTNAGHLYPYRVEASGRIAAVENPARPLGVGLAGGFRTVSVPFAAGDLWVLTSDGIVEATPPGGDEAFGFARLEAILARAAGGTAAAARDAVLAAWRAYTGLEEPEDDRTLVVIRILPAPRVAP